MKKSKEGSRSGPGLTADEIQTVIEFFQNMLTIMTNDCKDAKSVVEKMKMDLQKPKEM